MAATAVGREWVTVKKAEERTGLPSTFFDERTGASGVWPEGVVWKWWDGRKMLDLAALALVRVPEDDVAALGMPASGAPNGFWLLSEIADWLSRRKETTTFDQPTPQPVTLAEGMTHLYRHFDAQGRLLYVGVSISALQRLVSGHRRSASWFWSIARVEVQAFATRAEALEAERLAIKSERPLHNIVHANTP